MKIKIKYSYKLLLLFLIAAFMAFGFLGDDTNGVRPPKLLYKTTSTQESGKQGDAYRMWVNNINLPLNSKGTIADVEMFNPENGLTQAGGRFAGHVFLFSSGFFLSGNRNGQPWANACASATLVEDYVPGTVGNSYDPNAVMYVLNSQDEPFGKSWQDWKDAVALGADFYDGDGDGVYNPVNKDNDDPPEWDPDEDMPDLIGDETVWCVYHDGLPIAQRRWSAGNLEVGVEIRQTVFAFASAGAIGNLIFVRYRFKYVGINENDPDELTDVLFGVWADPDVGDHTDDVVGSDIERNSGYTYNRTVDAQYGSQVPCFMIDFFSGPRVYIDGETFIDDNDNGIWDEGEASFDTAYSVRGQLKGIAKFPGAKNLPISSFVEYINGDQNLNDPNTKEEARFYMEGKTRQGDIPDPCTWPYGNPLNFPGCDTTDARFWFSGDPVTGTGWLCANQVDQRQMTNTGPFLLKKNQENEIVVAYVVGKGSSPLDGITKARAIDDGAQNIFDLNFLAPTPPPAPQFSLSSSDEFIDILWETNKQVTYTSQTPTWDLKFEGYRVWAFKTNVAEDFVQGQENSVLIATYDLNNYIHNVYKENSETGGIEILYPMSPEENQLDYNIFADPATGRLRMRIFNDPFDAGQKVVKGRPYYFAITSYALNYGALVYKDDPTKPIGTIGDYYLSAFAFAQEAENIRSIKSIVVGQDALNPPVSVQPANKFSGASLGRVGYDVINNEELTGDTYEVSFFKNTASIPYSMFWRLKNINTGEVLQDSSLSYSYGLPDVNQKTTEGFITKVESQNAAIDTIAYSPSSGAWYASIGSTADSTAGRGIWYVGKDLIPTGDLPEPFKSANPRSTVLTSDKLRRVELRFGPDNFGKAYRYINGYVGTPATNFYPYAERITSTDTTNKGVIGMWNEITNRAMGFVDVPFQAWVVDEQYDQEYQLAVGFIEARKYSRYAQGNPDGKWDPGTSIRETGEMIVIFNSPYDPTGSQIELTGGEFQTGSGPVTRWADLVRIGANIPVIPPDAVGISEEQKAIFASPWLNTMYLVGLERKNATVWFTPGDVLTIPLAVYPYTAADSYQFKTLKGTTLSEDQERALWEKVNVYPNPLFGYNTLTNYYTNTPDEPFVTFTNLPEDITVKIYSLSGTLLRTLGTEDKSEPTSPFLNWNLQNESGIRVASGMYLAIISSPKYGDKVLKFAIIMPQKQIQRF
ncbi:MAG: hypothetical protein HXY48_11385 [Ignavibacteriaceae bacterium]|nr:hypothetical protein [Ignavibacteriaceae bacterium]